MSNILETERLILRNWTKSDINDLFEFAKSPNIGPNAGWQPHIDMSMTEDVLKNYMEQKDIWAITLKDTGKVIGSIGLHVDRLRFHINCRMISYAISEDYWGKGFGTESCDKVVEYAFQVLKLDLISAYHYPDNVKSERILEKMGFHFEGVLRCSIKSFDNEIHDESSYTLLKEEYDAIEKTSCLLD